jgi:hypothetical protein
MPEREDQPEPGGAPAEAPKPEPTPGEWSPRPQRGDSAGYGRPNYVRSPPTA